jgi:hypothetical protein
MSPSPGVADSARALRPTDRKADDDERRRLHTGKIAFRDELERAIADGPGDVNSGKYPGRRRLLLFFADSSVR